VDFETVLNEMREQVQIQRRALDVLHAQVRSDLAMTPAPSLAVMGRLPGV
jgi:hypothetical protein